LTQRKRRSQNKPNKQATRHYTNGKKDSESNSISSKKVSDNENQEASSLKLEQPAATAATPRDAATSEVFGSSSFDATSEMKDSACIYENDLKKAISNVQKKQSIKDEDVSLQPTSSNAYVHSANPITILKERISVSGGSRDESSYDENRELNDDNPFMSSMALWQSSMNNWIGRYKDLSENVAEMMREYWMKPFWISDK
jgi:hypothetical protein